MFSYKFMNMNKLSENTTITKFSFFAWRTVMIVTSFMYFRQPAHDHILKYTNLFFCSLFVQKQNLILLFLSQSFNIEEY